MGTAFSDQSKEGGQEVPVPPETAPKNVAEQPPTSQQQADQTSPTTTIATSPAQGATEETTVDASHPRSQADSKEAFARVAAAGDADKNAVLSAELASAEAKAEINLAQFFDALESRCETDEEREALKKLVAHRKEEQQRWKLAQNGQDPNNMTFPTGDNFVPPKVMGSTNLEWWASLPLQPRDVNEQVFPLRHFEARGDADQATQEEVPTSAESLREEMAAVGTAGWVSDELADGEVVNNKDLSWVCTPPIQAMTEDEIKFLNGFWERRGLGEEKPEKDFATEVEAGGAWAPVEPLDNVIANDLTTPDQEAVIKLRETRGALPDEVRQRRVKLLAQHFAEREQKKLEARGVKVASPTKTDAVVPASTFFEERLEVATEESTKAQQAKRLADHEAAIDALAAEGAKYTSFGSPVSKKAPEEGTVVEGGVVESSQADFPFTSPEAKARVDAIIARREKERAEAAMPKRSAPKPPLETETAAPATAPPQPPSTEEEAVGGN